MVSLGKHKRWGEQGCRKYSFWGNKRQKERVLNCIEGKGKWKTDCMDRAITVCNKFHPSKPVLSCYDNLWMKTCLLNGFYS